MKLYGTIGLVFLLVVGAKLNLCVCCKETLSGIVFFACCGQYVVRCLRLLVFWLGLHCVLLESASHVMNVLIISNPVCIVRRMDKCTYIIITW